MNQIKEIYKDDFVKLQLKKKKRHVYKDKFYQDYTNLLFFPDSIPMDEIKQFNKNISKGKYDQKEINQIFLEFNDKNKKKTVFLDLDETIVHVSKNESVLSKTIFLNDQKFYLNIRPFFLYFLKKISKKFEIFIFTAGNKEYAEFVAENIDPKREYIDVIVHKKHCFNFYGQTIKDLTTFKNRSLKNMILIDNLITNFGKSIENGVITLPFSNKIPIISFFDNEKDKELFFLTKFLLEIVNVEDVREVISKKYNLRENMHN